MKYAILSVLYFTTVSCNQVSTPAVSYGNINRSAPYIWDSFPTPKSLRISEDFSEDEIDNIIEMSTAWTTAVEDKKTFLNHGAGTITDKSNTINNMDQLHDSVMGIYKTRIWPTSLSRSALAVTQLFGYRYNIGKGDEFVDIIHGDILINYDQYRFYTGENKGDGEGSHFDLRTVVLHELGHFLGLQHKIGNTVMVTSVSSGTKNRAPTSIDSHDIADKYGIILSAPLTAQTQNNSMMSAPRKVFKKYGVGEEVKILIELRPNGECVHKEDGVIVKRHFSR